MLEKKVTVFLDSLGILPYAEIMKNVLCYFRYIKRQKAVDKIKGVKVQFSTTDGYSKKLFYNKKIGVQCVGERAVAEEITRRAKSAKVFADVGSHVGYFSCIAGVANPGLTILSFEMNSNLVKLIEKNLRLNGLKRATAFQVAVSDVSGKVFYRSGTYNAGERMVLDTERRTGQKYCWCNSARLDDLFIDNKFRPDLIKVDVEGAELKVLRGAVSILNDVAPVVFLEVHPQKIKTFGDSCEDLIEMMLFHEYKLYIPQFSKAVDDSDIKWKQVSDPCVTFKSSNETLLCVPRGGL